MRIIPLTSLLIVITALLLRAATINETIISLNNGAKTDGPAKVLQSISASTHVPVATLEKQKAKTNFSYGDLFVAHAIARAANKSFDEIVALRMKGQTWDKVAENYNVSLAGNKKESRSPRPIYAPSTKFEHVRDFRPVEAGRP